MKKLIATRGLEHATRRSGAGDLVRTTVNGRSEMLPDDPKKVAKILRERRAKKPAALRAKERMAASMARRGLK
jgi:hypothetical protein